MSKLALLSDMHITYDTPVARKDNFIETQKSKLNFIFNYCEKTNLPLVCAGDIFDGPRSWRAMGIFSEILRKYKDVQVYSIFGQHDAYLRNIDLNSTALGFLVQWEGVKLLGATSEMIGSGATLLDTVFVYGMHYGQEEIPVPSNLHAYNILVVHKMITDRPLWPGQTDFTDASYFLSQAKGFSIVHVADAHRKFLVQAGNGRIICNTGPLLRSEATEEMFGHQPCFYVLDTELQAIEIIDIPCEPADQVLSRGHIEWQTEKHQMLDQFISTLKDTEVKGVSFVDNLVAYLKTNQVKQEVQNVITKIMEGETSE